MKKDIVVVSGYFLAHVIEHKGYHKYIQAARKLADKYDASLVAIISSTKQQIMKYGRQIRDVADIVREWRNYVDDCFVAIDEDRTCRKTLEMLRDRYSKVIFFKDGNEYNNHNLPEAEVEGIKVMFGNNEKEASSSEILGL